MIISFAKTVNEYEAGLKTCTRRVWKCSHFEKWRDAWLRGDVIHQAWSNLPFVDGARRLQDFRLTCCPYWERLGDMPEEDLIAEGGMCKSLEEFREFVGLTRDDWVVVVRFEKLEGDDVK